MNKIKLRYFGYIVLIAFLSALIIGSSNFTPSEAKSKDDKVIKLAVTNLKVYEDTAKIWAKEVKFRQCGSVLMIVCKYFSAFQRFV